MEFRPSSVGGGNVLSRTRRQIVVLESPVRAMTAGTRSIFGDSGDTGFSLLLLRVEARRSSSRSTGAWPLSWANVRA